MEASICKLGCRVGGGAEEGENGSDEMVGVDKRGGGLAKVGYDVFFVGNT